MHDSALMNAKAFFDCYSDGFDKSEDVRVVEIGSQDVNGSLKDVCPAEFKYVGVDFIAAKNVDVVLHDPYKLPFPDNSVDIVVSSSCLEHSEFFWLVFLEMMRVLKPHGLLYINVPSHGGYHRYPVDCWRFYPDSGVALSKWGRRNGFNTSLLESYTQPTGRWGDFVAVFIKDQTFSVRYKKRIVENKVDYINGRELSQGEKILHYHYENTKEFREKLLSLLVPKFVRGLFGIKIRP